MTTLASVWDHAGEETQLEIVNHQRSILLKSVSLIDRGPDTVFDPTYDIEIFEQNLLALMTGGIGIDRYGVALEVPPPQDASIRNQLVRISTTWDSYRDLLINNKSLPGSDSSSEALLDVSQNQYSILIDQLDEFVVLLEEHMANDHRRLLLYEWMFILFAIPLIIFGGSVISRRIVDPLLILRNAAARFGKGDLSTSIQMVGNDEMKELADTFETMRSEIIKSKKRLEEQVTVRTHELSVAFEFSRDIVQQLEFENLMKTIVEKASLLMQSDHVSICLMNPVDNAIEMYVDSSRNYLKGNKPSQPAGLVKEVTEDGEVAIAPVVAFGCKFIASNTSKQCVSVPLRSGDRIIGAVCALRDRSVKIDESETKAFALLANSAAIAIENLRLIRASEQHARMNAVAMERQRIISELHDNLIQMLNLVNLKIGQIRGSLIEYPGRDVQSEFDLVKSNVTMAIEQVRTMMGDIASPSQVESTMVSRVEQAIRAFEENSGKKVDLRGTGSFLDQLATLSQKQLLMILNEALTNIHRHADAEKITVLFEEVQDKVLMTIADNGRGFQTDLDYGNNHYGLRIMRTRAERSGGSLFVESEPGRGTKIMVSFPFAVQV